MPRKDPLLYVIHIRDSCERITRYISEAADDWPSRPVIMDAVCRNLQILGEAARRLDPEFQIAHPEVPWKSMIALRNIVTHSYDELIPEVIREIVERDIPPLLTAVRKLLEQEPR